MAAGFSITINGVDNASSVIGKLNKNIAAARAPVDRFNKEVAKFKDLTGIRSVEQGFGRIAQAGLGALQSVSRVVEPLAAITGIASVSGMARLVTAWADYGQQLQISSFQTGIAATQLQRLQNAGRLAGVSAETVTAAYQGLGQAMYDAIGGRNADALGIFKQLNIQFDDGTHHIASITKAMEGLADQVAAREGNPQAQMAILQKAGVGVGMLPFLRQGAARVHELMTQAERHGLLSNDDVKNAGQIKTAFTDAMEAAEGFGNSFAAAVGPKVQPWLDRWTQQVDEITHDLLGFSQAATEQKFIRDQEAKLPAGKKAELDRMRAGRPADPNAAPGGHTAVGDMISAAFPWLASVDKAIQAVIPFGDTPGGASNDKAARRLRRAQAKAEMHDLIHAAASGDLTWSASINQQRRAAGLPTSIGGGSAAGAMAYFQSQGWSRAQAAGIVANIGAESGFKAMQSGDHGAAYGLGQWHAPRQADYAKMFGHTMQSVRDPMQALREQLEFYQHELTDGADAGARKAGRLLRGATTGRDAGGIVSRFGERPAAADEAARNRGDAAELLAGNGAGGGHVKVEAHIKLSSDGQARVVARTSASGNVTAPTPRIENAMTWA